MFNLWCGWAAGYGIVSMSAHMNGSWGEGGRYGFNAISMFVCELVFDSMGYQISRRIKAIS